MARGLARAARTAASVTEVKVARSTERGDDDEEELNEDFDLFFVFAAAAAASAAGTSPPPPPPPNSPPPFSSRLAPRALSSSSTCQLIASPSLSGSVASTTVPPLDESSAAAASASSSSLRPAAGDGLAQRISKPAEGSTEPALAGRSRTWPKVARTLAELPRYCWILRALAGDSTMTRVVAALVLLLLAVFADGGGGGGGVVEAGNDDDDGLPAAAAAATVLPFVAAIGPRSGRDVRDDIVRAASDSGELRRAADAALAMPAATAALGMEIRRRCRRRRWPIVSKAPTAGAPPAARRGGARGRGQEQQHGVACTARI